MTESTSFSWPGYYKGRADIEQLATCITSSVIHRHRTALLSQLFQNRRELLIKRLVFCCRESLSCKLSHSVSKRKKKKICQRNCIQKAKKKSFTSFFSQSVFFFGGFITFTQFLRGLLFSLCSRGCSDISEHGTHFLASAFPNLATRSEVAYLLCVLLLPFRSWQGLPRTAQRGHLPPTAICAQVLLIPLSVNLSLSPSPVPPPSLSLSPSLTFKTSKHIRTCLYCGCCCKLCGGLLSS